MEWHHTTSPTRKKFKSSPSVGKVMASVFWDEKGVILLDFWEQGNTVNADRYIETLKKLRGHLRRLYPFKDQRTALLLHDNATPHTAKRTIDTIAEFGWTLLPHPRYSPDLAPSDFHLFGPLKEDLRGHHFEDTETLKRAVRQWFRKKDTNFYRAGIHALVRRWTKTVTNNGDYIEK